MRNTKASGMQGMSYKLVTYDAGRGARAGIIMNERVFDVADGTGRQEDNTVLALLTDWPNARTRLERLAAAPPSPGVERKSVSLLAPIPNPGAIFCAGANYADHVLEMAKAQNLTPDPDPHSVGLKSWHFIKTIGCIAGPDEVVTLPRRSSKVDWEAELVAIVGRTAKDVPIEHALEYVAGYTIANDLSARDFTKRAQVSDASPFKYDWVAHKCFDKSCPLGPWIVPSEAIKDPQNLAISLSVNGVTKQNSNTSVMIFNVAEQVSHLSEKLTLRPGDVILTGTPAGVGTPRGEFLKPGDEVRISIEGIGELVNRMN
jgi:2-keto-4-pentenoate hydratase/2-oxohepta-3-ene-1,7-dioic acid hydratase in catechol pathway